MVSCGSGADTAQAEAPAAEDAAAEPAMEEAMAEDTAAEPVTIDVWFHSGKGEEREVLDAQVTAFNEMQNDVQVNAILLPEGSYNDQVNAGALAGDLPCSAGLRWFHSCTTTHGPAICAH